MRLVLERADEALQQRGPFLRIVVMVQLDPDESGSGCNGENIRGLGSAVAIYVGLIVYGAGGEVHGRAELVGFEIRMRTVGEAAVDHRDPYSFAGGSFAMHGRGIDAVSNRLMRVQVEVIDLR